MNKALRSRRRAPAVRPLLLIGSVTAGLLLTEGVLHLLDLPREYRPKRLETRLFEAAPGAAYLYVQNPSKSLRFVYDRNPRGYFAADNSVTHRTNAFGFRGPEFNYAKPAGTVRILFVGDSFTFGEGVKDGDTYPERFRELALESTAFQDRGLEVVNLGVGGYNTDQEYALLRDFGMGLSPDRIVVGYCLNDAEPPLFFRDADGLLNRRDRESQVPEYRGTQEVPGPLGWFRFTRLAYLALENRRLSAQTIRYYEGLYRVPGAGVQGVARAMAGIARLARERGVRVTVVIFPLLFRLEDDYPLRKVHDLVRQIAEREGLEVVDLLAAFRGHSGPDLWVHPTDQHPNEVAHRLAAAGIWEFLRPRFGPAVEQGSRP